MKIKRLLDIFLSIFLIVVFIPIFLLLCFLIYKKLGYPILYKQTRPGKGGIPFTMIKFRTMLDVNNQQGEPLSDAERLTSFGRALRATSLDELPELWNVLKGEMSLVGPRPLLCEYLPLYTVEQAKRHDVRPGITGWAQINGRNAISWEEKFKLDVWYVKNQSFWLDMKILFLTIKRVFFRENISATGEATMTKFIGTNKD